MKRGRTKSLSVCAMFAALIAIGAFIRIPVTLVPFTLQVTFVILSGWILGAKKASVSVLIYVISGLIGLPVFVEGGGPGYVLHPTFGYISGFVAGAALTGFVAHRSSETGYFRLLASGFAGLGVIYSFGIFHYYIINRFYLGADISIGNMLLYCFFATIPGDIVLTCITAAAAKRILPVVKRISS